MNKNEFLVGIKMLKDAYNKDLDKSQLKVLYENLKDLEGQEFFSSISISIQNNKFYPTVAEIRDNSKAQLSFKNINLNSCYWYINERMWCDEHNKPYYDITTGQPLAPYKN